MQEDNTEIQQSDKSSWPGDDDTEDEEEQLYYPVICTGLDDQKMETFNEMRVKGQGLDSHSETEHAPHVKTSAVSGVGLQELLELIDGKLVQIDKDQESSQRVIGRSEFDRKWRPPQADKIDIAVEQ